MSNDGLNSTVLKLYDSQGNLIGQQTNQTLGIFTFTVKNLPVAKWRIESIGAEPAGEAIDNVCFNMQKLQSSTPGVAFTPVAVYQMVVCLRINASVDNYI